MFDINFIEEPGFQKEISDATWSYLHKKNELVKDKQPKIKESSKSFIRIKAWKDYVFSLSILSFIVVIGILFTPYAQVKPNMVLSQVIDIILESGYKRNIQLLEANFSQNQVKVIIRSQDFSAIQALTIGYRTKGSIPYEMYQKEGYNYLNLTFPWKGNKNSANIQDLQSLADSTVFYNKVSIEHVENIFDIQGRASDIIAFLLKMAEKKEIQKYIFSIFHDESGRFNLKFKLNPI
jgi:hypothetical protein